MTARRKKSPEKSQSPSSGLGAYIMRELDERQTPEKPKGKRPAKPSPALPPTEGRKRKITLYFREALLEEARSAVLGIGAEGLEPSNLSQLFGQALERELVRLRKIHNEGEPFEPYRSRLPGGRPRGK